MEYLYDVSGSDRALLNHPVAGVPAPGHPRSYWMCFGLWPHSSSSPTSFVSACESLAQRVGQLADLSPHHRVLEVGCGAGDAMLLWLQRFRVKQAIGVEVVPSQQQLAQARVAAQLCTEASAQAGQVLLGSATQLPVASNSQDAVLAVDCAYHFNTRQQFFTEAARVLVPQGKLAMVDAVWDPHVLKSRWAAALLSRLLSSVFLIPTPNHGNVQQLEQQLHTAGLTPTHVQDITHRVVPGFAAFVQQQWWQLGGRRSSQECTGPHQGTPPPGLDIPSQQFQHEPPAAHASTSDTKMMMPEQHNSLPGPAVDHQPLLPGSAQGTSARRQTNRSDWLQRLKLRLRWLRFLLLSRVLVQLGLKWRCLQFVEVVAVKSDGSLG